MESLVRKALAKRLKPRPPTREQLVPAASHYSATDRLGLGRQLLVLRLGVEEVEREALERTHEQLAPALRQLRVVVGKGPQRCARLVEDAPLVRVDKVLEYKAAEAAPKRPISQHALAHRPAHRDQVASWCRGRGQQPYREVTAAAAAADAQLLHALEQAGLLEQYLMSEAIKGYQWSSEVIRGHQRSSEVIRDHQRSSVRPSEVIIRGHRQRSSPEVIGVHQRS